MSQFCGHCGAKFLTQVYPKECAVCREITYRNPTPVAVMLYPVVEGGSVGYLLGKRGIAPGLGEWALPSGFVEDGESFEEAACRELFEETGLRASPRHVRATHSRNSGHGHGLVFCLHEMIVDGSHIGDIFKAYCAGLVKAKKPLETTQIMVAHAYRELAFSLHTEALLMALGGKLPGS